MSREIKFRAWDRVRKEMLHDAVRVGDHLYWDNGGCFTAITDFESDSHRHELMQCTGLCDKDGREVYEGDVLLDMQEVEPCKVEVKWCSRYLAFMFDYGSDLLYADDVGHNGKTDMAVIGNIYENPELIA